MFPLSDSQDRLGVFSLCSGFQSALTQKRSCAREVDEKGRVRVRAPPGCITHVQLGGRLAGPAHSKSSSGTMTLPLGVWVSGCENHSGVLRVRTLLLFSLSRVPLLAVFVRPSPRVTLSQGRYGSWVAEREGRRVRVCVPSNLKWRLAPRPSDWVLCVSALHSAGHYERTRLSPKGRG